MAKPNYAFEKRQRDLAKQRKKEEKRLKKAGKPELAGEENSDQETPLEPTTTAPEESAES